MMINKRLIAMLGKVRFYILGVVGFQWLALVANIVMVIALAFMLGDLFAPEPQDQALLVSLVAFAAAAVIRGICAVAGTKMSHLMSVQVKSTLRTKIYQKVLALGAGYNQRIRTSEIVQLASEGVEQLESYFGRYLPQLFYSTIAPITLFCVLAFINLLAAVVLLVAVPLILVAIMLVSTMARKLFAKYWGIYTDLGANFLENLQGLTTLKIYQAEERKRAEMSSDAEAFRKVTMKVLSAQLGSITAMDLVALGGAAVGIITALLQFQAGAVDLAGCLTIILLSAEFFIPMRQLGSYFHVAMNGVAASDKIFALLDLPQQSTGQQVFDCAVELLGANVQQLSFAYADKPVLKDVSLTIAPVGLTSVVGKSGCGKSTLALALTGGLSGYKGSMQLQVFDRSREGLSSWQGSATQCFEVADLTEQSIMEQITLVTANSHIFKGTVRENLHIAYPEAKDEALWEVLSHVKLDEFLRTEAGLDTQIAESAANLSGGQRQRLALARALLHDTPLYIFDEATSNIDAESENFIMDAIKNLALRKAVLLISHRLANVVDSELIYVLDNSSVVEQGKHADLLAAGRYYANLYTTQSELENFSRPTQAQMDKIAQHPQNKLPDSDSYREVSTRA
jgi:ATP-binding cassette subfamily B protein/ATP-binding cassette subfamily C protein